MNDHARTDRHSALPRPEDFPFRLADNIRYVDMDRQGHVNNAVYSTFFETGRVFMFRDPRSALSIPGAEFVLARLEIDYLRELRWPGTVEICTGVARIGKTSLTLDQAVFCAGECAARGRVVMVLIDTATRRPRPYPEQVIARLQALRPGT